MSADVYDPLVTMHRSQILSTTPACAGASRGR